MSFLKRLFNLQTADDHQTEGTALWERHDYGQAKLAFERALEKSHNESSEVRTQLESKVAMCRDAIASQRVELAREHLDAGDLDLAQAELASALDVAASSEIRALAQDLVDSMEQREAVDAAIVDHEVTDEERLAVVAGAWEAPQAEEFEAYGEDLDRAILALQDENAEEALIALDRIEENASEPRYLHLERAKALLLLERESEAGNALHAFLDCLLPGEGGDARLAAHVQLARIADEQGDFEGALAEFQAAIDEMETDCRPYHAMGNFLRVKGMPTEAREVLELAASLMSDLQPDWTILFELALAQAACDSKSEAIETLESIIELYASRGETNYPPPAALALASLCEDTERLERAADLYRTLASGSDQANHGIYHREAGRVLLALGLMEESRRMLKRAMALSGENADLRDSVTEYLKQIDINESAALSEDDG